jgi:hypothetical protein
MMGSMWDQMKSTAIRQGLNMYLKTGYGEVTDLEFDGKGRSLRLKLQLNGESSPIDVEIGRYHPELDGENLFVVLTDVRVSRAWLQHLVQSQVEGKRFKVPASLAGMAKLMLA